ncbi:MAG: DUF4091 domain-containing protein [Clostridia bacterium]|nr:DUF4091 domain-containing protein [Clostridia bacterium]
MSNQASPLCSWIVPSEHRVFCGDLPRESVTSYRAMRNEPISFSLAYRATLSKGANGRVPDMPISVSVTSDTLPLTVYKVLSVPFPAAECEDAAAEAVGPCPDMLVRRNAAPAIRYLGDRIAPYIEEGERVLLNASCAMTGSLFVTANEGGEALPAGRHRVCLRVISLRTGETLAAHEVTVELIDALLPESELIYTTWFHYDCLAESHRVPLWSDEYFRILGSYIRNATRHGMNTLLTPAFTPPLDTPVGTERMNVQLVGVRKTHGGYDFDFSLLRRFVAVARENGIRTFEHCHLFSQWGATQAINVYGEEGGRTVRLFGWDTPASDPAYLSFLREYLTAFVAFAEEEGIGDCLLFHISDEPKEAQLESYAAALRAVEGSLRGKTVGDALSDIAFYRHGLVRLPIVDIAHADEFDGECEEMMLYYTGGESKPGLTNRLLTSAPRKTRILGLQLYRYRARGFLHWAYNNCYGRMSLGLFDPATDPCFYKNIPGVTYLVYPGGAEDLMPSLREKQLCAAVNDHRALCLLESLVGRERTLALCEDFFGGTVDALTLPTSGEEMRAWRETVNEEIARQVVAR